MQCMLWFLACLILLSTYSMEKDELFITKLGHRWYTFTLIGITAHLWARGSSWKMTTLNTMAIIAAIHVDTSQPNPAAIGLLFQSSLSLTAIIMSFDRRKHIRSPLPPFAIQPSEGEHPNSASWEDMSDLAPDLLAEVEYLSSDDSSDEDEDHQPLGFLDGPFILGHLPPLAG